MRTNVRENSPNKLGLRRNFLIVYCDDVDTCWDYRGGIYHCIKGCSPYIIADRVLKKYVDQHVDLAFSYYCKLMRPYHHFFFLDSVR